MSAIVVDFYFGLSSRYSYLAHSQIDRISAVTGAQFNWKPFFSPALMDKREQNPFAGVPPSGAYDAKYRLRDVQRWAAHYAIPYIEIDGRLQGDRRLFSHAAVAGALLGQAEAMSRAIFKAVFAEDRKTLEKTDFIELAGGIGLDETAYARALDAPETQDLHDRYIDDAIAAGAFGVPTFVCEDEMWFGNDRLLLLKEWLMAKSL